MEEKIINGFTFIPYEPLRPTSSSLLQNSQSWYRHIEKRRSVRDFSSQAIDEEVIKNIIRSAATAPSGANKQPWTFCVVSSAEIKKEIREAAEKEEFESYTTRMSSEWLEAIKPLQTDWHKQFLETAPYLIVVFKKIYITDAEGNKHNNYYVNESVGMACGFLLTAIHQAGLVALTHTPSPMNFLTRILDRPANERPFLLIPVGYPAKETFVPKISRNSLNKVIEFYR